LPSPLYTGTMSSYCRVCHVPVDGPGGYTENFGKLANLNTAAGCAA
jgi:hypothetical protein